jgi:hypothetical protein
LCFVISLFTFLSYETIVLMVWGFFPFAILPFVNFLGIPKIRLVQCAPFVPLGILLCQLLFVHLKRVISEKWSYIIAVFIIIYSFYSSVPILINRTESAFGYIRGWRGVHIPQEDKTALDFIAPILPKESVILADERMGNILPAFAPIVSYFGHSAKTKNFYGKATLTRTFFSGTLTDPDALLFVKNNRIRYVWYGLDERKYSKDVINYSFLHTIYNKDGIIIFQIYD